MKLSICEADIVLLKKLGSFKYYTEEGLIELVWEK